MKRNSYFLIIAISVTLFFRCMQSAYGNAVVIQIENPIIRVPFLVLMFFVGSWVEYMYFNSRLFHVAKFDFNEKSHYGLLLKINLVTFPLTQMFAYFFYINFMQFFWLYVLFIEIGVIAIEFLLFRTILPKLVEVEIPSNLILKNTIVANTLSFLLGLVAFLPIYL